MELSMDGIWPGIGGCGIDGACSGTPGLLTAEFIMFRAEANLSVIMMNKKLFHNWCHYNLQKENNDHVQSVSRTSINETTSVQSIEFKQVAWQGSYSTLKWLQFWNLVPAQTGNRGKLSTNKPYPALYIYVITEFWLAPNIFISNKVDQDMVAIITKPYDK